MSRAFSVLWTMQERQAWLRAGNSIFTVAYGNSYRSRGVEPGDALYILSCGQGSVWLWGRMVVKGVEDPGAGDDAPWARDAVRADPRLSTRADPDRLIPPEVVSAIRFGDGQAPAMRANGPDPQTFRGIRRLSEETQTLLENMLSTQQHQKLHAPQAPKTAQILEAADSPEADILSMRALSVRQPYVELILRGAKKVEYRSTPTTIRGRVLLYASRIPGPAEEFTAAQLKLANLIRGAVVGSVEVVDCRPGPDGYEWGLRHPRRLPVPMIPDNKPQPIWFHPFRQG